MPQQLEQAQHMIGGALEFAGRPAMQRDVKMHAPLIPRSAASVERTRQSFVEIPKPNPFSTLRARDHLMQIDVFLKRTQLLQRRGRRPKLQRVADMDLAEPNAMLPK